MANPLSSLSGNVKQAGTEAVGNAKAVNDKTQMVRDYENATKPAAAPKAAPLTPPSPADKVNPKAKFGNRPGEQRIDTNGMTKPLGSFKKGGKVKKTGVYKLHAKEQVLNAKTTAKVAKKGGMAAVLSGKN